MKLVIQRVTKASVSVEEKTVGEIGKGLFVLVGIKKDDSENDVDRLVEKLLKLRIMADENGKMNLTVNDVGGEYLIVSQFTLFANTTGGNRPSFIDAAEPKDAKKHYEYFIDKLRVGGAKVKTGSFGDYMDIRCQLDGPVTIILES